MIANIFAIETMFGATSEHTLHETRWQSCACSFAMSVYDLAIQLKTPKCGLQAMNTLQILGFYSIAAWPKSSRIKNHLKLVSEEFQNENSSAHLFPLKHVSENPGGLTKSGVPC